MKKIVTLALVLLFCLTPCACGSKEKAEPTEIETMAPAATEATHMIATQPTAGLDESSLEQLCGEWRVLMRNDLDKAGNLVIQEDGTLLIDGKSFTWQYTPEHSSIITLSLFDGEEKIGRIELWIHDDGDLTMYYYQGEERMQNIMFYKPSIYEFISINKENVFDYFEFRDTWDESRNAFGELTHVTIVTYLVPKEPYYSRLSDQLMDDGSDLNVIENGAIEWEYQRSGLDVVLDLEEKTYTFVNFKSGTEDTKTHVAGFGSYSGNMGFWARRMELIPNEENCHSYTWACTYEMEILRLKLDMYLLKK